MSISIYKRIGLAVLLAGLVFSLSTPAARASDDNDFDDDDDIEESVDVDEDNSGPGNADDSDRAEEIRDRIRERQEETAELREELRSRIKDGREEFRLRVEERRDDIEEHRTELRLRLEEHREEVREHREEIRLRIEERTDELRARFRERLQERVGDFGIRVIERFRAAILRLEDLADRIASRIEKLEEKGFDLSEASGLLATARDKIDLAILAVDEAEAALNDLIADDTDSATTTADVFFDARELLHTAKDAIKEAHAALVDAIVAIRANVPSDDLDDDDDADDDDTATTTDDSPDVLEFESAVTAASDTSVTLSDGRTIAVDGETVIDPTGDLTTLAGVVSALGSGQNVRAEGTVNDAGDTALTIKFEIDEA